METAKNFLIIECIIMVTEFPLLPLGIKIISIKFLLQTLFNNNNYYYGK